jgi:hypothetical protein
VAAGHSGSVGTRNGRFVGRDHAKPRSRRFGGYRRKGAPRRRQRRGKGHIEVFDLGKLELHGRLLGKSGAALRPAKDGGAAAQSA